MTTCTIQPDKSDFWWKSQLFLCWIIIQIKIISLYKLTVTICIKLEMGSIEFCPCLTQLTTWIHVKVSYIEHWLMWLNPENNSNGSMSFVHFCEGKCCLRLCNRLDLPNEICVIMQKTPMNLSLATCLQTELLFQTQTTQNCKIILILEKGTRYSAPYPIVT